MKLVHTVEEAQAAVTAVRSEGLSIGLVPTMGALHEGHITLVRRAREQCGFVVVSVFVNPTQFGPNEDFDKYPRTLDADADKCREAGVDLVFAPSASEMYPEGFDSWVDVNGPTQVLEGLSRPIHFRGVTTVCTKLFNITGADYAFFGKKDYQQLVVIRKMVHDLNAHVQVVPVDTVREPDGLAMSSRNRYLSPEERQAALVLSKSLAAARDAYQSGQRDTQAIQLLVENLIKAEPLARIDYVAVVDSETLQPIGNIERLAVVLLAVRVGATRLIDNTELI
ncbi:MAG: pantoate--beta-alanine ligase [Armatimonadota bacterium]|nr:pantoate--beta-alanine ligase [bacterium]